MKTAAVTLLMMLFYIYCEGQWTPVSNFNGGNREITTFFTIKNKGYVGCGRNNGTEYHDLWEFSSNTWTQKASYPGRGTVSPGIFVLLDTAYIICGWGNGSIHNEVYCYEPVSNIWRQKSDFPGTPRYSTQGFAINTNGFIVTGWNGGCLNDFWKYDEVSDIWSQLPAFPSSARQHASCSVINGKAYFGLGYNSGPSFSDWWEFDPVSSSWLLKASFPGVARRGAVCLTVNNQIITGFGYDDVDYFSDFWFYDAVTDSWSAYDTVQAQGRYGGAGFVIDNCVYVGTGSYNGIGNPISLNDFYMNCIEDSSVVFSISSTPATCLANNGTITVSHTGGSGNYSYQWTPSNDTTLSTLTGLIAGVYSVIATDLGTGISQTLTTIVTNSAGITATIVSTIDAVCENDENGSATVIASGGTPPYFYLWPNGDTSATTNHLEPGTYFVRVEDYLGCPAMATFTIGFQFAKPNIELGNDTMVCSSSNYILDAGPGFASYLWNDNSTNQLLAVTHSGLYSVLVTNLNGCQSFDAINISVDTCFVSFINQNQNYLRDLIISPNPTSGRLFFSFSSVTKSNMTIIVLDLLGNVVHSEIFAADVNINYKEINLSNLSRGIYILSLENEKKEAINLKVIIE